MLNHSMKNLALGAALALTVGGVWAQSTTPITPSTNIGVTPQNANEATQKAVPQANTGTLVRTEPSAATRAEEATTNMGNTNMGATNTGNTNMAPNNRTAANANRAAATANGVATNDSNTLASSTTPRNARPLRADRN